MKKSKAKRLVIIFSTTLLLSVIGMVSYLASNPVSAQTYFSGLRHNSVSVKVSRPGWLDFIPFMNDEIKEYVNTEINDAIHEGLTEAKRATDDATSTINRTWTNWDYNWSNNNNWRISWNNNHTKYDTTRDSKRDVFSQKSIKNISINADITTLTFVEEERSDIQVDYVYSKPDTDKYKVDYEAEIKGSTLHINQDIHVKLPGGIDFGRYDNDITVRVPKNFKVDKIVNHQQMGDIRDSKFYSKAKSLELSASLGKINISLEGYFAEVDLSASMGSVTLFDNDADIDNLTMVANSGKLSLDSQGDIKNLTMNADMGSIELDADGMITNCTLEADMGSVKGTFREKLTSLNAKCDMGSINLTLYDNDDTTFDTAVSMGKLSSDFTEGSSKNFNIKCSMGNITLNKK